MKQKVMLYVWLIIWGVLFISPGNILCLWGMESPLDRFTPEQKDKLLAGEILFQYVIENGSGEKGLGHGEVYAVINRPIEECYRIITDIKNKYLFFPHVIESSVIKSEGNRIWEKEVLDFKIRKIEYVLLITFSPEHYRMDFRLDPNYPHSLKDTRGYRFLEKLDEKSALLTHAVTKVDVGIPVPGFIRRALSSRDLPNVVRNLKKRIESGGTWSKSD